MKSYAVKFFLQHSKLPLEQIAHDFAVDVQNKCFINEKVVLKSDVNKKVYRLCKIIKGSDKVVLDGIDKCLETSITNVTRAIPLAESEIYNFLTSITKVTPFGVLLIENALEKIADPKFKSKIDGKETAPNQMTFYPSVEVKNKRQIPNNEFYNFPQKTLPPTSFDLSDQEILTVNGYSGRNLDLLIKTYQFFFNYKELLNVEISSLEDLGELIKGPYLSDKKAAQIYFSPIKFLEPEIDSFKVKNGSWLLLLAQKLFPKENSEIDPILDKKKFTLSLENWKSNVKTFLCNLSCDLEFPNLLILNGFVKKNSLNIRLELLSFLIDLICSMETFRESVNSTYSYIKTSRMRYENLQTAKKRMLQQPTIKIVKSGEDTKVSKDSERMTKEIKELHRKLTTSPLKILLGINKNYYLFLLNNKFCLKDVDQGIYYVLNKKGLHNDMAHK